MSLYIKQIEIEQDGEKIIFELGKVISTTWDLLLSLRSRAELIPGTWYEITDYICTTTLEFTSSTGKGFPILMLAISSNKLSEECRTSSNPKWKIWYCLDNDTKRFSWADVNNGKGVIYRMIDEFNNDVPYDFKNILFERCRGYSEKLSNLNNEYIGLRVGNNQYYDSPGDLKLDQNDIIRAYTFSWCNLKSNSSGYFTNITGDASLNSFEELKNGYYHYCGNNKISPYYISNGVGLVPQLQLNNIVFFSGHYYYTGSGSGYSQNYCSGNVITADCHELTFIRYCSNNTIGAECCNNIIRGDDNIFSDNCTNNIIDGNHNYLNEGCSRNVLNMSSHNYFGNYGRNNELTLSNDNIFKTHAEYNKLDNNSDYNTFGSYCTYNELTRSSYNTFGNRNSSNKLGEHCDYNTFGNQCWYIDFGSRENYTSNSSELHLYSYYRWNTFEDHVRDICIYPTSETTLSDSELIQNLRVHKGVCGGLNGNLSSSYPKLLLELDSNFIGKDYEINICKDSTGELTILTV